MSVVSPRTVWIWNTRRRFGVPTEWRTCCSRKVMSKFGDTPRFDAKSLCGTCRCAQVTTGLQSKHSMVLCRMNGSQPIQVPQPVISCSDYDDKRMPAVWELEKIAWRLSGDKKANHAGFIDPTTWKRRVKDGLEAED